MSQQEGDDGELRDKGEDATLIEQFMQSTEGENTESIRIQKSRCNGGA